VTVQVVGNFQIALSLGVQVDRQSNPMRFDWMGNCDPAALTFDSIRFAILWALIFAVRIGTS
jgi:hypothetical protein